MKLPIYLDYHATTPVDPAVFEAMAPYFTRIFGNAASRHHEFGWTAEAAVEAARSQVAALIGATEKEIIFTSGGTESNNLALKGTAEAYAHKGRHIISSNVEHKSILETLANLETKGFRVTYLSPDRHGRILPELFLETIQKDTILASFILGHNEIGTLNPIQEIGKICREKGILLHSDAVQVAGYLPLSVDSLNVDLLTLTAHKMYGPKGAGALYVRRKNPRVNLTPQILGGGHERGMRSGTLNVPGIVGLGKAAEVSAQKMSTESARLRSLRDHLWNGIQSGLDEVTLIGHPTERLPHNLSVCFGQVEGESLMMGMREIAVSSGSACGSSSQEPSYILKNIGLSDEMAHSSIRFGLGRLTTEAEIDFVIAKVIETVKKLRNLSPLYVPKNKTAPNL